MLEVSNLCFSYGKRQILNNLSFNAEEGECVVLAGPNGSGKSTVLGLLAGVIRPISGTIRVDGKVGYVPQGSALFEDMRGKDNLKFFAHLAGCSVPNALPFGVERHLDMQVSKMSGGMKKQLSITCALLGDPDIILMDEPCAALDIGYRDELIAMVQDLKAQGKIVIYAGHEPMEFVSFYDRLLFLSPDPVCYTRTQLSAGSADVSLFCKRVSEIFKRIER